MELKSIGDVTFMHNGVPVTINLDALPVPYEYVTDIDNFSSDRTFKIWEYTVSMGLLLLRSARGREHATQVDLLFRVTAFVCLPTELAGLVVREASSDEAKLFEGQRGPMALGSTLFRVNDTGWVVARSVRTAETEDEYFVPSPLMTDYSL